MAYPSNGNSISFEQINVEQGNSATAQLSLGQAGLNEWDTPNGAQISMDNFYVDASDFEILSLGYHASDATSACNATFETYIGDSSIITSTNGLWRNPDMTVKAQSGYYSNGPKVYYWDDILETITFTQNCGF